MPDINNKNKNKMSQEKKNEQKLTYEQLNNAFCELHTQYQKLTAEYRKALEALNNRDFDYTSFFLTMLFKVLEHPEMYKEDFVKWAAENVQNALTSFAAHMEQAFSDEAEQEEKDGRPETPSSKVVKMEPKNLN